MAQAAVGGAKREEWADMESTPTSPTAPDAKAVPAGKRPMTMADVRFSTWQRFGAARENDAGLTQTEKSVFLELGSVDQIEKEARDEVFSFITSSLLQKVVVPKAEQLKRLEAGGQRTDAAGPGKAAEGGPSSPTSAGGPAVAGETWDSRRKARKEEAAKAGGSTSGPGPAASASSSSSSGNNVIRVQNIADSISPDELRRVFGPENGLGTIQRVYLARDKEGNRRGFAYITYETAKHAADAITKMHKKAFKMVILSVDYGTPNPKPSDAAGPGGAVRR